DIAYAAPLEPGEHRNSVRVRDCLCCCPGDAENESRGRAPVPCSSCAVHARARHHFVPHTHVLASGGELDPAARLARARAGDLRDLRPASQRHVERQPSRRQSALVSNRQRAKRCFGLRPVTAEQDHAVRSVRPNELSLSGLRSTMRGWANEVHVGERNQNRMRLSWKLGRVAGIDLYVHATFLLVFLFVPGLFEGGAEAVSSIMLILSVFGCVLLHEFGHALMARRFGIETEDITLYPIGGVARLRRLPRAPGAELLITLAGPAVNFAIVAVLLCLAWGGVFEFTVRSIIGNLLVVNLLLGAFNLVPAFPMGGGRILTAVLSGFPGRA